VARCMKPGVVESGSPGVSDELDKRIEDGV